MNDDSNWKKHWKRDHPFDQVDPLHPEKTGYQSQGARGIVKSIFRVLLKIVGFLLRLVAMLGIVLMTFVVILLSFKYYSGVLHFSFSDVISLPLYFIFIALSYLCVILPLSLLSTVGNVLMFRYKPSELSSSVG